MNRVNRNLKILLITIFAFVFASLLYIKIGQAFPPFDNPHGNYTSGTPECAKCHLGHNASSQGLVRLGTQREACYACHDGSNGSPNIKMQFGESTIGSSVYSADGSYHPVPTGQQVCTDCHDPHLATEQTPGGTASLLTVGEEAYSSGNQVCSACHFSGGALSYGDLITSFVNTPHDTKVNGPSSGTGIKCTRCHEPHGSPYESLIRREIEDLIDSNIKHVVTGNNNTVCFACHSDGAGKYPGDDVFQQVKHSSSAVSTVALSVYPGTDYQPGMCLNCHEPHGRTGLSDYKRAEGNDLCITCHDDATVNGWAYSYQGTATYNQTPHSTAEPFYYSYWYYTNGNSVGYELSGAADPALSSLTDPVDSGKMDAAAAIDGSRWITGLTSTNNQYNYQIYKFKVREPISEINKLNFKWTGYGEPTPGYPTDMKVWNGTAWQVLDSEQLDGPADGTLAGSISADFSNYVDANGYVYLLARAKHDGDIPVITVGPIVTKLSATSARIQWTTNEFSTTSVDYGTSTSYGETPYSNDTLTKNHDVVLNNLTGLTTGTNWYFRVHSRDALGNEVTLSDYMEFKLPVFTQQPYKSSHTATSATLQWTTDELTKAHIDFGSTTGYGRVFDEGAFSNSHTVTLNSLTGFGTGTKYYYRVRAYDQKNNLVEYTGELDISPPTFSNVSPANGATVSGNSFNFTWITNELSSSYVDYGLTTGYGATSSGAGPVASHTVTLNGLELNKTYYYRIRSTDLSGNEGSVTGTFITPASSAPSVPVLKAPLPPDIVNTSSTSATVNLYWDPSTDVEGDPITYEVQIGGSLFSTTNTSMQVQVDNYDTLYWTWQVRAKDPVKTSDWSTADTFSHTGASWTDTCSTAPDPSVVKLASMDTQNRFAAAGLPPIGNGYLELINSRIRGIAAAVRLQAGKTIAALYNGIPLNVPQKTEARPTQTIAFSLEPYLTGSPIINGKYGEVHYSLNTNFVAMELLRIDPEIKHGDCVICHAPHGQTDSTGSLIPKQLKLRQENLCFGNGSGCHSDQDNSVQKVNIAQRFTVNQDKKAHHSVRVAEQDLGGTKVLCSNCHDPHLNTATDKVVNPDSRYSKEVIANNVVNYVDVSGSVYFLVEGMHDGIPPVITSGPAPANAAGTAMDIVWNTDENATEYVFWDTDSGSGTADYVYSAGVSSPLRLSHSVHLTGLTPGQTYYYRIKSTDALGNDRVSNQFTFLAGSPPPRPNFTGYTDSNPGLDPSTITVSWGAVTDPDGQAVEYQVEMVGGLNSGWITGTSYPFAVNNSGTGTYYFRVKARDSGGLESAWTPSPYYAATHQGSSCPDVFTWDGEKYVYITDMAGSDVGLESSPGKYAGIIPDLPVPIPWNKLQEKDGRYTIKIKSERDEVDFLDYVGLQAVDHPVGTRVTINDLVRGEQPIKLYSYSADVKPVRKATYVNNPVYSGGKPSTPVDITGLVSKVDNKYANGPYGDDHQFTLDLGNLRGARDIKLVINGWTEFTNKAEREADRKKLLMGAKKAKPFMEVLQPDGTWKSEPIKHINGYTKTSVIDLTEKFPQGTTKYMVRLRGMLRPYIDFIGVDTTPQAELKLRDLELQEARLGYHGVSKFSKFPGPNFDYYKLEDNVTLHQGEFTRYGDAIPLLQNIDDRLVVMDSGDELTVSFKALPPPAPGMTRTFILKPWVYYKEFGLAKTNPMPFRGMDINKLPGSLGPYPQELKEYVKEWNTRIHSAGVKTSAELKTSDKVVVGKATLMSKIIKFWANLYFKVRNFFQSLFTDNTDYSSQTAKDSRLTVSSPAFSRPGHYSVNTDQVIIRLNTMTGTNNYYPNSAGSEAWESNTLLTPDNPGSDQASAGEKTAASTDNGSYLTTNLATAPGSSNYQMYSFKLTEPQANVRTLAAIWNGYGEPTAGFPVKLYVWNFSGAGSWELFYSQDAPAEKTGAFRKFTNFNPFCNKCHDNTAVPTGVLMGTTRNIASTFATDVHGGGTGPLGYTGAGIAAPYWRNDAALPCSDCHDPHGSENLYHLREYQNGLPGKKSLTSEAYTNNPQVLDYCKSCHVGTLEQFHSNCLSCHQEPEHYGIGPVAGDFGKACSECHFHGGTFPSHGADAGACDDSVHGGFWCGTSSPVKTF